MTAKWDADVATAMRLVREPGSARVLAAEVTRLRAELAETQEKLIAALAKDPRNCAVCGELATAVEVREGASTRYFHGRSFHVDGLSILIDTPQNRG